MWPSLCHTLRISFAFVHDGLSKYPGSGTSNDPSFRNRGVLACWVWFTPHLVFRFPQPLFPTPMTQVAAYSKHVGLTPLARLFRPDARFPTCCWTRNAECSPRGWEYLTGSYPERAAEETQPRTISSARFGMVDTRPVSALMPLTFSILTADVVAISIRPPVMEHRDQGRLISFGWSQARAGGFSGSVAAE